MHDCMFSWGRLQIIKCGLIRQHSLYILILVDPVGNNLAQIYIQRYCEGNPLSLMDYILDVFI